VRRHPFVVTLLGNLKADGSLEQYDDHLVFNRDVEFSSPSAAATVVHGACANGLAAWKDHAGKTLKAIEG
jgi:hypothetical protein